MKSSVGYNLLALLVVALWGVTFICTKVLIGAGLLPAQIFAIRFSIAYLGIWVLCARAGFSRRSVRESGKGVELRCQVGARALQTEDGAGADRDLGRSRVRVFARSARDELVFVLLGVSGGSVYFLTENTALACTQACNVSFIVCSAPLLTALLTIVVKRCFRGEIPDSLEDVGGRWQLAVGTLLALAGMAAVFFDGNALELSAKGDLLSLAAASCWAVYSIFMNRMTEKYGALFATRKVFFYGLVTIVPIVAGTRLELAVLARPEVWGNLLFLSVVASLACFVLWNKVMLKIGNVSSTNFIYLNPLFTLVFAIIFLGESLTLQSALGCAAILLGVILGSRR